MQNAKKIGWKWICVKSGEVKELYNELTQKDIDALEREESDESDDPRKCNILNTLNNEGSVFTGA